MSKESLCCDTCNRTHFETIIMEKPVRVCYKSKVTKLEYTNKDMRKQDNICLDCLSKEVEAINC